MDRIEIVKMVATNSIYTVQITMPLKKKSMVAKKKTCNVCKKKYTPTNFAQVVCGVLCSLKYIDLKAKKRREKQRRLDKIRLEELKTKPKLIKEAQKEFNKYIRLRDKDEPCISCLRTNAQVEIGHKTGGWWDAGHYLPVGAFIEHRFNENNCHKQCKSCNGGSGKYTGKNKSVSDAYDINIINRIGLGLVLELKDPIPLPKLTKDEIRYIRDKYRKKCKGLLKK